MPVTFTYDEGADGDSFRTRFLKVTASWTTDDQGDAAGTSRKIVGRLIKAVTIPADSPTDDYNVVLTDSSGVNVLSECDADLQDRDTANTEEVYFLLASNAETPVAVGGHPVVCSPLTVTIDSAGDTKSGTVILYVER